MKQAKITYNSYKLLEDVNVSLDVNNLYFVKGQNGVGKTSFIKGLSEALTALGKTKNPVTHGKKEGYVQVQITDDKYDLWNLKYSFTNNENSFTLIRPDNTKTKSVTDIRNLFKFNDFSVDEFFSWGVTAEGRRKQAEILMKLLPEDKLNRVIEIGKTCTTSGPLYKERTFLNKQYQDSVVLLNNINLSDDDIKYLNGFQKIDENGKTKIENYTQVYVDLIEENNKLSEKVIGTKAASQNLIDRTNQLKVGISDLKNEIESLKETLKQKENNLKIAEEELSGIPSMEKVTEDIQNWEKAIVENNNAIQLKSENIAKYKAAMDKKEEKERLQKVVAENEKSHTAKNDEIQKLLDEKTKILTEIKFPELIITDEELFFKDKEQELPFDKNSISYSVAGKIITRLLLMLNKELPIVLLGNASEYDQNSKQDLLNLAKEFGGIIIADTVTETGELTIEGYEEL